MVILKQKATQRYMPARNIVIIVKRKQDKRYTVWQISVGAAVFNLSDCGEAEKEGFVIGMYVCPSLIYVTWQLPNSCTHFDVKYI